LLRLDAGGEAEPLGDEMGGRAVADRGVIERAGRALPAATRSATLLYLVWVASTKGTFAIGATAAKSRAAS
jgi:hypothetical protein